MSNLSIKDVPEQWAEVLRQRAARNHRSLQGELLAMVEAVVVNEVQNLFDAKRAMPDLIRQPRQAVKTVEQIAIEMNAKFPNPVKHVARAVDIIRAERDAR